GVGCAGDASEVGGIDVDVRSAKHWMVEDICRIQAELELLTFRKPYPFDQVGVQCEAGGAFDHISTQRADLPGDRIYQDRLSFGVEDGEVRVPRVERVRRGNRVDSRVRSLSETGKVHDAII